MKSGSTPSNRLTLKSALNASISLLNAAADIVVSLIVSPLLLNMLGPAEFGVWKFCSRLLSFVSAAEGQATQALKWTITKGQSSRDLSAKQREIGSALIVWLRVLPFLLASGGILSWFAPSLMNDLDPEYHTTARLTCAVLVFVMVVTPLKVIPQTVMVGMNRGYKIMWLRALEIVVQGALMVGLVRMGLGADGPAWATWASTIVAGLLGLFLAKKALPWLKARRPSQTDLSTFFGFSIWVLAWAVISRFVFASDLILLGMISSPEVVTTFSLSSYVVIAISVVILALVNGAIPGLGGLIGAGDLSRAARVRAEMMRLSWLLNVSILSVVLVSNESFVSLWVGHEYFVGHNINLLIVIAGIQQSFIRVDSNIINVTLEIRMKVLLGMISAILCVALAFLLSLSVLPGVEGVLVGLLLGRMVISLAFPILVARILNHRWRIYREWRIGMATVLIFGGMSAVGRFVEVLGWTNLVLVSTLGLGTTLGVGTLLGLRATERRQAFGRITQLIQQSRN